MTIKLSILGATGSIGQSTLSLIDAFPEKFQVKALSAGQRVKELADIILKYKPELVSVKSDIEKDQLNNILKNYDYIPQIEAGEQGNILVATHSDVEVVLSAISGAAGLKPTWAALQKGCKIALANKETLVVAGEIIIPEAKRKNVSILPVDSEHSAIFQALGGLDTRQKVSRLILTASGGPFFGYTTEQLKNVTVKEALNHPSWSMGMKISCDSATLMNKGLELIEAHHFFQVPYEQLEVLVHPKSFVHSIVEFIDGSQLAQLGSADMRLAIAYAFSYPDRWPLLKKQSLSPPLELNGETLSFFKPDVDTFRALKLAFEAGKAGGTAPAILNAANEIAVEAFINGKISFLQISQLVEQTLNDLAIEKALNLETLFQADKKARQHSEQLILSGYF